MDSPTGKVRGCRSIVTRRGRGVIVTVGHNRDPTAVTMGFTTGTPHGTCDIQTPHTSHRQVTPATPQTRTQTALRTTPQLRRLNLYRPLYPPFCPRVVCRVSTPTHT